MLAKYFDHASFSVPMRKILALSVLSSIIGKVYNVDGVGLDIFAAVSDESDAARTYLQRLVNATRGLDKHIWQVKLPEGSSLIKRSYIDGSYCVVTDMKALRPTDNAFVRREQLLGMYDNSGANHAFSGKIDQQRFELKEPATSALILDDYSTISRHITKTTRDEFFERVIYALERPSGTPVFAPIDDSSIAPSKELVQYLLDVLSIAETLEQASVHISVPWQSVAAKYFANGMEKRWSKTPGVPLEMNVHAYKKMKKLCALFAVYRNLHAPLIEKKDVDAALSYLDIERNARANLVDTTELRIERKEDLYRKACENLDRTYESGASRNSKPQLHALGMLPVSHLLNLCGNLRSFAHDPILSKLDGIKQAVNDLVMDKRFTVVDAKEVADILNTTQHGRGRIFTQIVKVNRD